MDVQIYVLALPIVLFVVLSRFAWHAPPWGGIESEVFEVRPDDVADLFFFLARARLDQPKLWLRDGDDEEHLQIQCDDDWLHLHLWANDDGAAERFEAVLATLEVEPGGRPADGDKARWLPVWRHDPGEVDQVATSLPALLALDGEARLEATLEADGRVLVWARDLRDALASGAPVDVVHHVRGANKDIHFWDPRRRGLFTPLVILFLWPLPFVAANIAAGFAAAAAVYAVAWIALFLYSWHRQKSFRFLKLPAPLWVLMIAPPVASILFHEPLYFQLMPSLVAALLLAALAIHRLRRPDPLALAQDLDTPISSAERDIVRLIRPILMTVAVIMLILSEAARHWLPLDLWVWYLAYLPFFVLSAGVVALLVWIGFDA